MEQQLAQIFDAGGYADAPHQLQPEEAVEEQAAQVVKKHRRQPKLRPGAEEKLVLQFMDSLHNRLSLSHALSSALRQGWMELASARHSMGAARINSAVLDLKFHSAATRLNIAEYDVDSIDRKPCFVLRKWVSSKHEDDNSVRSSAVSNFPIYVVVQTAEVTIAKNLLALADDNEVQKERSKSLSTFGILISPKLRAAQVSFERALETLVEIANMQSSLLYSFNQLHQEEEDTEE